jgi:hypothetical protein
MEEVESCLDNSDIADMGDEATAAEADKENLSSSSPNISQQLSASEAGSSAGKRPPSSMLTVVNEKGGRGKAAGKAAAAGSSPAAAMNSRGAMLLNLSRYVTTARREIRL